MPRVSTLPRKVHLRLGPSGTPNAVSSSIIQAHLANLLSLDVANHRHIAFHGENGTCTDEGRLGWSGRALAGQLTGRVKAELYLGSACPPKVGAIHP
jgi:hypothetical protein